MNFFCLFAVPLLVAACSDRFGDPLPSTMTKSVLSPHFAFKSSGGPGTYTNASLEMQQRFATATHVDDYKSNQALVDEIASLTPEDQDLYLNDLEGFYNMLADLARMQDPDGDWESLAEKVMGPAMRLLALQNAGDPFYFVSHSATHGIRVATFALQMYSSLGEAVPLDIEMLFSTNQTAEFAVAFCAVLHDVGYAAANTLKGEKWHHAQASARMNHHYLHNPYDQLVGYDLADDMIAAVGKHNYDVYPTPAPAVPGCKKNELKNTIGDDIVSYKDDYFTVFKQPSDCSLGAPGELERTYTPAIWGATTEDTLQVLVRFADNMDAMRARLTPYQRGEEFQRFLGWMYLDDGIRSAGDNEAEVVAAFKTANIPLIQPWFDGTSQERHEDIPLLLESETWFNHHSFMHIYSNWIIKTISMDGFMSNIELHDDTELALAAAVLPFTTYYQLVRSAEAAESLTIGDSVVTVTVTQGGATLVDNQPLRRFNPVSFDRTSRQSCEEDRAFFLQLMNVSGDEQTGWLLLEGPVDSVVPSVPHPEHLRLLAQLDCPAAEEEPWTFSWTDALYTAMIIATLVIMGFLCFRCLKKRQNAALHKGEYASLNIA